MNGVRASRVFAASQRVSHLSVISSYCYVLAEPLPFVVGNCHVEGRMSVEVGTRGGLARPVRIPYCESLRFVAWAREAGRWTREHPRGARTDRYDSDKHASSL